MKKLIGVSAIAIMFAACGQSQKEIAKQQELDSLTMVLEQNKAALAQQHLMDSMSDVVAAKEAEAAAAAATASRATRSSSQGRSTHVTNNYSSGNAAQAQPAASNKREGWSSTATGAVIGAGVGAISGAMIDEKKGRGAVIGGIGGAGIGAGTGAIIDANKKKKEQGK